MSAETLWEDLTAFSDTYTCYSAAVASWVAHERDDWPSSLNPGLALRILDAGDGLLGFVHFPPGLRARLGLVRVSVQDPGEAIEGILAELARSGRVIVAGDGFRLPWHVARGRRHVPHWYVLSGTPDRIEAIDPFACRNELGAQMATRVPIARERLTDILLGLPSTDPVLELRERLALGDDCGVPRSGGCQWFVHGEVSDPQCPRGSVGPNAVLTLARHMRERAQDPDAYRQADDIWSIGRHRAFLARHAAAVAALGENEALVAWAQEHAEPLARRWSHMAPLMMQARLALSAGRAASDSVWSTLQEIAEHELAAAEAIPAAFSWIAFDNSQPSVTGG